MSGRTRRSITFSLAALLLLVPSALAENMQAGVWRFGARVERMVVHAEPGIPLEVRISESCISSKVSEKALGKSTGKKSCLALDAIRRASDPSFRKKLAQRVRSSTGGAEPGSLICRGAFSADVALAEDETGNRNAFCSFADGSRVSTGSLASVWTWASKAQSK